MTTRPSAAVHNDPLAALASVPHDERQRILGTLSEAELGWLSEQLAERHDLLKFEKYRNDPEAFIRDVLGETVWSKQREVLRSVVEHKRTAVPACHAPGKTHLAARIVAWWVAINLPGTGLAVTTAPNYRQVRTLLWPHIRRLATTKGLPGTTNLLDWRIGSELVSYGFAAAQHDESAVQGIHVPRLLVVVDEAGGIKHTLGRALDSITTGDATRLLLLGNPPTDEEGSWFESCCTNPLFSVVRIAAKDTPAWTGENPGPCRSCPPGSPDGDNHPITTHLIDKSWAQDIVDTYGPDSAFAIARVDAQFPRDVTAKVIPVTWAESALTNDTPDSGDEIRLGVDVAADGGDEFVIARADGMTVRIVHHSAGQANASQVSVAGKIKEEILRAETDAGPDAAPIRVKIDSIGIGRGVTDFLAEWEKEGQFRAQIVPVNVAMTPRDQTRFKTQRSELWWNGRELLRPDDETGRQKVRLDVDARTIAQLAGPLYSSDSAGRLVIEAKDAMKRRGIPSPDRAEAVLLALFDPPPRKNRALPVRGAGVPQTNQWSL